MRWPPLDTDRNRILLRLQAVLYALGAAYFLIFALVAKALVPWVIAAAFLTATVVAGVGLLLMREQRRHTGGPAGPDGPR